MAKLFNDVVVVLMKYGVAKAEAVRIAHELMLAATR